MNTQEYEKELAQDISGFRSDPLGYVLYAYPWGTGDLVGEGRDMPRDWQVDILRVIGDHLSNPDTRFTPLKISVASGHGIGKSALISQVLSWGMSTCDDCKSVVTANTESQLRTKTWPEVTKWSNMAINSHWFKPTSTALISTEAGHESNWRADAVPWSENNTEAFAGLHNQGKRIILIFDEASNIADKVWDVAEGAMTDKNTEIIWIAFGNPTRNKGRFRECFRKFRHRWVTRQIDSRDVKGVNLEEINRMVEDHGEDSDHVKIRVRGIFPELSANQFISEVEVDAGIKRYKTLRPEEYEFAPVILTCDPAWSGKDDLVIGKRQGLKFDILRVMPKNDDDIKVATTLARLEDETNASAVFIDAGYGTGIVSAGKMLKRKWQLVWFGSAADDAGYLNKRSEMWGGTKTWLKDGGCIPDDKYLRDELIMPETIPRSDGKIQLQPKTEMDVSPGRGDALALSFAYPVRGSIGKKITKAISDHRRKKYRRKHSWMG